MQILKDKARVPLGPAFDGKVALSGLFKLSISLATNPRNHLAPLFVCVCGAAPSSIAGNFRQTKRAFASGPKAPGAYYFLITSAPLYLNEIEKCAVITEVN